jgi:uncharacterized protein YjiS (DUF1127 family)
MLRSTTLNLRPNTGRDPLQKLSRLVSLLRAEWRIRRAMGEVRGLGDEMLRDIGLSRADIERCVRHGRPSCPWREEHRVQSGRQRN